MRDVAVSFIQAREYFHAASVAGETVKPLLLFYGVQALSRGLILFTSRSTSASALKPSHGLDTLSWRETLAGDVRNLGKLTVVVREGVFYDLLRATDGGAYLRANSSAVNWHFSAQLPALGFRFTLVDLAQKIPDLEQALRTWTGTPVPMAVIESLTVDDVASTLSITLRGALTAEMLARLFPEASCGCVTGESTPRGTVVTLPRSCQPFYAQLVEGAFAIGDVVLIPPFSTGEYLSPIAVYYAAAYVLGMFARYFPGEWVGLARFAVGDAALPLIKRLLQLIEIVFPELVLTYLRAPYPFERQPEVEAG